MLKRSADAIVNWKGFDQAIDRWLDERHKLILQLSDFAADHNFSLCTPEVEDKLRAFIAQLIDYVSAGHFEFYQRLADEGREFDDVEALANIGSLLEAIDISTQAALEFNEKYEQIDDLSECVSDISDLAETLVTRFDAEDQMIQSLHRAHLRQITA